MAARPSLLAGILKLVTDLTFAQPARRNLLLPLLLTVIVVAGVLYALLRFTPHRTADLAVDHVSSYAAHTVFKSESIVVGRDAAQDDLYLVATVRLTDDLRLPLFIKDITATLTPADNNADGNELITTSAVEHPDLPNLYTSFPSVKKIADTAGSPLLRELRIEPGQTAEGFVILHFPVTQSVWDQRKEATLTVSLYHQQSQTVVIPKQPVTAANQPSR